MSDWLAFSNGSHAEGCHHHSLATHHQGSLNVEANPSHPQSVQSYFQGAKQPAMLHQTTTPLFGHHTTVASQAAATNTPTPTHHHKRSRLLHHSHRAIMPLISCMHIAPWHPINFHHSTRQGYSLVYAHNRFQACKLRVTQNPATTNHTQPTGAACQVVQLSQ